jgi:4-hydroxybenzoate polyprenyltransferase
VSASVLGASLAFLLGGGTIANLGSMLLAIVCVVLMQYVAHPMNDVMDLELDRRSPIGPTGRHKPLVDGTATVREVNHLSAGMIVVISLSCYT